MDSRWKQAQAIWSILSRLIPLALFLARRHNELRFCCGAARPKRRAEPQQNLPRIGGAGAAPPAANAGYVERHRGRLPPGVGPPPRGGGPGRGPRLLDSPREPTAPTKKDRERNSSCRAVPLGGGATQKRNCRDGCPHNAMQMSCGRGPGGGGGGGG